jgi:hypothetical protein
VVLIQVNEECRDSTLYFFALRTSEELKMAPSDDNHSGIRRSDFLRGVAAAGIAAGLTATSQVADAQDAPPLPTGSQPKPATSYTKEVNALYRKGLPFDNKADFEDARRGLIASLPDPAVIRNATGVPVWDLA